MDAVSGAKEIATLIKKYNDLPLYEKIVTLQAELVEQAESIVKLNAENADLKRELALKSTIIFKNPYYYQQDDEIPLCPKCFSGSGEKLRIHLTDPASDFAGGHGRKCRVCSEFFREGPRAKPLSQRPRTVVKGGWMS